MRRPLSMMIISFPVVLVLVAAGHYSFDLPLSAFCQSMNPHVTAFFAVITHLGVSTWYLIGTAALFFIFRLMMHNRDQAQRMFYLFSVVALSGLATNLIKWIAGRWRPNVFPTSGLYGFELFGWGYEQTSFPSGHATTICSLAFALSVLYPRWRLLWLSVALLVCLSRVVIGAHYPSDVLMGAYVGIFTAILLRRWPLLGKSGQEG